MDRNDTIHDRLDHLYRDYERDRDLRGLFGRIYSETRSYCLKRLSRDPDLVADFLVDFFEKRFERVVAEFVSRSHPSFPGFYLVSVRHSFSSFIRSRRRRSIPTVPLHWYDDEKSSEAMLYHHDQDRPASRADAVSEPQPMMHRDLWRIVDEALSRLGGIDPVLFKIYHNIPLNIAEVRLLATTYGVDKAECMLHGIQSRRDLRIQRLEIVRRRIDRFAGQCLRGQRPTGLRKRGSYLQAFQNRHWIHSVQGLAGMLEMSKQLASFRLRRTTRFLKEELVDFGKEFQTEEAG